MNATELRKELRIGARTLEKWLEKGLPFTKGKHGRQFDSEKVKAWLVGQGLVARPQETASTVAAAAKALGISERTFHTWLAAGCPARVSGGYDVAAAREWSRDRYESDPLMAGPSSPQLERYRRIRGDLLQLELDLKRGTTLTLAELEAILNQWWCAHKSACEVIQRNNLAGVEAVAAIREAFLDGRKQLCRRLGAPENFGMETNNPEGTQNENEQETPDLKPDPNPAPK
jgi:phage terminase Nu1 subunit (DNA packaging protein)